MKKFINKISWVITPKKSCILKVDFTNNYKLNLSITMDFTMFLGLFAGVCTTLAVVPQLIKAWKTKKVDDISPLMFTILIIGVGLWVVYGILKKDIAIIATNGLSLLLNMSMVYIMLRYNSKWWYFCAVVNFL